MQRRAFPERPDWRAKAEAVGFGFHEMYGEPYWQDDAAFVFSLAEIEDELEDPSAQIHQLCLDLVGEIIDDDAMLARLAIPETLRELVRSSWHGGHRHLYGRFDFAYDGTGRAKLLEYNADTPTSIFESAFFQYGWLTDNIERGLIGADADQFNSIQEVLVEALEWFSKDTIFHFAAVAASDEDRGTAAYLMDCAVQAGHRVELLDMAAIGVDASGRFTDGQDRVIDRLFKLYPWEDMAREPFARHLAASGTQFIEPAWKAILSNKALMPLLWERHPGHPNLLESYFADDPRAETIGDHVRKPFHSREGENVTIFEKGEMVASADGAYGESPMIVQALAPLFVHDGRHAVIGSWIVGDTACGIGLREDAGRITRDLSRFVPHFIEG